jgi:predicted GTPase
LVLVGLVELKEQLVLMVLLQIFQQLLQRAVVLVELVLHLVHHNLLVDQVVLVVEVVEQMEPLQEWELAELGIHPLLVPLKELMGALHL